MITNRYSRYVAITKSDTVDFDNNTGTPPLSFCDAIYVGGAGIVAAVDSNNVAVQFTCVAGQVLPVRARRVNNTNTTATLMVALYDQ